MPNSRPLTITQEALDDNIRRASDKSLVNYGFFILLARLRKTCQIFWKRNPNPDIKIFMGSMHGPLLVDVDAVLEPIFAKGSRLIAFHAEDQPRIAERRKLFADRTNNSDLAYLPSIPYNRGQLNTEVRRKALTFGSL